MGSRASIKNSRFVSWIGRAISAGEESEVTVSNSLLASGHQGILIKNASAVTVDGVLLYDNKLGVRIEPVSEWYSGKDHLKGQVLYAVDCGQAISIVGRRLKTLGRIATALGPSDLEPLRSRVLGLRDWSQLEGLVARLNQGGAR
jgi:hypothetical protein